MKLYFPRYFAPIAGMLLTSSAVSLEAPARAFVLQSATLSAPTINPVNNAVFILPIGQSTTSVGGSMNGFWGIQFTGNSQPITFSVNEIASLNHGGYRIFNHHNRIQND